MSRKRQTFATVAAATVVLSVVVAASLGSAGASTGTTATLYHGAENGNYTVDLPFDTDHYPRDENPGGEANASINHLAAFTEEVFAEQGVEKGIDSLEYIIIDNQDIDFSECKTENTAAFGIDRDNDDPGTKTDVGLLSYRKNSQFNAHSIVIEFYQEGAFAAPAREDKGGPGQHPEEKGQGREDGDVAAEVYPDDEIVAHQGYKSGGGPCYKMPTEPGWYQIHAFGNGTAFNGKHVEVNLPSHYFYICVCDSRQEAVEKLGPPPSQQSSGGSTDTPTATPKPTATAAPTETSGGGGGSGGSGSGGGGSGGGSATPAPTASPTPTTAPTAESRGNDETARGTQTAASGTRTPRATRAPQQTRAPQGTQAPQGGQQNQQPRQRGASQQQGIRTPTAGAGPGFGLVTALGALVALCLLVRRRR